MSRGIVRLSGILAAAVFTSVLSMGSASAAIYTSSGTCAVGDMSPAADQCFGAIQENVNDSESSLNNDTFGGLTGLFGYSDWDFLAKENTPGGLDPAGTNIGLDVNPPAGATSGTWQVNSGALDAYARLVFILKIGNTFSAYLYEPGSDAGSIGTWSANSVTNSSGQVQNLSHFSIYTSGVSPVPVPAAVWLFGTALIGFIGFSRRTKV